jgi:hypothetical protein
LTFWYLASWTALALSLLFCLAFLAMSVTDNGLC